MERRDFLRAGVAAAAAAAVPGSHAAADPFPGPLGLADGSFRRADGPIRLNSNENPLGIAPSARMAILEALADANRYPGAYARALQERLAAYHRVDRESVVLGNGSTEALQMVVQAVARPGTRLVIPHPTFEHVERYADPFRLELVKVPLLGDYAHDLDRMRDATRRSSRTVLVYICNPNNPTGSLTRSADVDAWIADAPENVVFLVDEAYWHYTDAPSYTSALRWVHERPNVVVVRTFSKIYGMAGLRLGYAVAHPETARKVAVYASGSNTNVLALAAGDASLEDRPYLRESRRVNDDGKRILEDGLDELGIERIPSHANFVMYRVEDTNEFRDRMREHDILVGRPFPPMVAYNRTSIGTPDQMHRVVEALHSLRRAGHV